MDQGSNEARLKLARRGRALNLRHGAPLVPALTLMTDDTRAADWAAAAAALPSLSAVIVRHRDRGAREALAKALRAVCRRRRVLLLIADDPDLAMRVRADGVHVPQRRLAILRGLRTKSPRWLLTVAAHDAAALAEAERHGAHAVFVSPVFATGSHPGARTLGVARLAALAASVRVPVLALGGIDADTIQRLASARIAGVGVIGAWIRS